MLKIKLSPTGKTNDRHYRIVVVEGKTKLTGTAIAVLGHYHPLEKANQLTVNTEEVKTWLSKGATPTTSIRSLLKL